MVTCPTCSHDNPPGSDLCAGCGCLLVTTLTEVPSAPKTLVDRVGGDPAPGRAAVIPTTPPPSLPDPMVEPIAPLSPSVPPVPPEGSALTRALLSEDSSSSGSNPTPAVVTIREAPKAPPTVATAAPPTIAGPAAAPPTVAAPSDPAGPPAPPPLQPRLVVVRGERVNVAYAVLEGRNFVGRSADKPVDIDLDGQEPVERIWTSRQHAVITLDHGRLSIEDLNSLNGTFVNRARIHAGQPRLLHPGDVVQIGTVQLKVVV